MPAGADSAFRQDWSKPGQAALQTGFDATGATMLATAGEKMAGGIQDKLREYWYHPEKQPSDYLPLKDLMDQETGLERQYLSDYTGSEGALNNPDNITSVYRAVGPNEYYNVIGTGKFNTVPTGMEVKQFGLDRLDTINFAERYPNIAAVLEVKIPKGILDSIGDFTKVDTTIFRNGTVTIHPEKLDIFNKHIKEIFHIY